jgi:NTE family protein
MANNNWTVQATKLAICLSIVSLELCQPAWTQSGNASQPANPTGKPMSDVKNITDPTNSAASSVLSRSRRPRVALALGGGGMRGAAHIGVLRVLMKAGIPIDIIAGTSMGAIVGGLYSAGISIEALQGKFEEGSVMKSFMNVPLKLSIAVAPVVVLPRTLAHKEYDGLYSGNKFRKFLDHAVPEYEQNIENLKIPFAAVALNLVDGKPYALTHGNLGYALQASSAVPGLREPVQIGDQLFVDGGVVDNIPVDIARAMGGDIVIAVDVDERFDQLPLESFKALGSVSKRMLSLQLASSDAMLLQKADIVIHPEVDGIGLISTKTKDATQAIAAGEKAAWDAIPAIKDKLRQVRAAAARPLSENSCLSEPRVTLPKPQ